MFKPFILSFLSAAVPTEPSHLEPGEETNTCGSEGCDSLEMTCGGDSGCSAVVPGIGKHVPS